jgi:hypothetical protein
MFSGKLVENRWRGDLVEELVYTALHPDGWSLCSGAWTSWDLRHEKSGLKIQVKQTAQLQTWGLSPTTNRYAVKPVKGFYKGLAWNALTEPLRLAEIYMFAHHPIVDETADHWDVRQWQFHVLAETARPPGRQSISIQEVSLTAPPIGIDGLAFAVRQLSEITAPNGRTDRVAPLPADLGDVDEAAGGSL